MNQDDREGAESSGLIGALVLDRYRVRSLLGAGSFAQVFSALDERLDQPVALKILKRPPPDADRDTIEQLFEAELRTLTRLQHPSTVRATDFGTFGGRQVMTMELLEGETLLDRVRRGPCEPRFVLEVMRAVAASLSEAHELAIVHCDLKPANIFVQRIRGGDEHIRVVDFGVARWLDSAASDGRPAHHWPRRVGTPQYMAPEQVDGYPEPASDLYALGLVAHTCLVGRPPFTGGTQEVMARQQKDPLPQLDPSLGVPRRVEELVFELAEKSAQRRPRSAQAVKSAAESLLARDLSGPPRVETGSVVRLRTGEREATGVCLEGGEILTTKAVASAGSPKVELGGRRYDTEVVDAATHPDSVLLMPARRPQVRPIDTGRLLQPGAAFQSLAFQRGRRGVVRMQGVVISTEPLLVYSNALLRRELLLDAGAQGAPIVVGRRVVGHLTDGLGGDEDHNAPYGVARAAPVEDPSAPEAWDAAVYPLEFVRRGVLEAMQSRLRAAARGDLRDVLAIVEHASTAGLEGLREQAAEHLVGAARLEEALDVLEPAPPSRRKQQIRALALDKLNRHEEAIRILERLLEERDVDAESYGILAGALKRRWRATGDLAALGRARELYLRGWNRDRDPYLGINAATLGLLLEQPAQAEALAREVLEAFGRGRELHTHWDFATVGEAHLLLGEDDRARGDYRAAVGQAANAIQDVAVMRSQAREILRARGERGQRLDDVFRVPRVVAFAGHMTDGADRPRARFPDSALEEVRRAIQNQLEAIGPVYAVCSAARGADIVFLEEVVRARGRARVILPFAEERFRSVALGGLWVDRFDRIKAYAGVEVVEAYSGLARSEESMARSLEQGALRTHEEALHLASQLGDAPLMLAVWDGREGDGPVGTATAVRSWKGNDVEVRIVRPKPRLLPWL